MTLYFAGLVRQLAERHVKPAGLSALLNAEVSFTVAANGAISGLCIVRSSGNAEFDRSVLEAFARVKLPGRPDGKTDVQTLTFRTQEA
jgi:colicin import membrane protein